MNNVIRVGGEELNMRLVICDTKDTYGHTLIIRHVNNLQSEVDSLNRELRLKNAMFNDLKKLLKDTYLVLDHGDMEDRLSMLDKLENYFKESESHGIGN